MPIRKLKERLGSMLPTRSRDVELSDDYIEIDANIQDRSAKIMVRTFSLSSFEEIKPILNVLREGHTIALINIAPIKDSDRLALKRAVDKLKKTLDANDGDLAAFGENWLVATPAFAKIYKHAAHSDNEEEVENEGGF